MAFKRFKKLNIEMTCCENKFWDYINNNLFANLFLVLIIYQLLALFLFVFLPLLAIDLMIHSNYLFHFSPNWQMLSAVNLLCYCVCAFLILKEVYDQPKTELR